MQLPKSAEAFPEFAMWLVGQDHTKDCIRGYLGSLRLWHRWCEAEGIDPVQAAKSDITRWLVSRRECSPATIHNNIVALRSYYRWAVEEGLRPDNPTVGIKLPRVRLKPVQPYSREEIVRLLNAARTRRDKALLLLLLGSGLRSSEILGITEDAIDWQAGTIDVVGKGRRPRTVAPGKAVMAALRDYVAHKPHTIWADGEVLSTTSGLRQWLGRVAARAGVSGAHMHRWRHTFACAFLDAGGSEGQLQKLLGHSTLAMTFHYSESVRERLALEAQRRLSPADTLMAELGAAEEDEHAVP